MLCGFRFVRKELLSDCCKAMKSAGEGTKTRVNINISLSQDVHDDGASDNDNPQSHVENQTVSGKWFFVHKLN